MAWESTKMEDQRKQLIDSYEVEGASMTELAKRFGVSRKTCYKWYQRYRSEGEAGLLNQSRAPCSPNRIYGKELIEMAIELKLRYRTWGPKKIHYRLRRLYPNVDWPSPTRLYQIFKELHLVTSQRIRSRVPATHPLANVHECNDVWMADFKGEFYTGDRYKCIPLTVTDGQSRFLLHCELLPKTGSEFVWPVFDALFREFGLPLRIRTDNGPPFGSRGAGRLTPLSVKIIKAGVVPEWINPGHPEENGRHERMHLTLKNAVANPPAETRVEQVDRIKVFGHEYNFERPHESLGMATPAEMYTPLTRTWDGVLRSPEYDTPEYEVRKIGPSGCIWLNSDEYYVSQTLVGEYVGLKEGPEGHVEVYFGPIYLGKLGRNKGLERPKLKPKKTVRRA